MEKQKLSGKTNLNAGRGTFGSGLFGICLYAGITGKFPNMHKAEHVMRFGDLKNWVSGGISAVMIFACVLLLRSMTSISRRDAKIIFTVFLYYDFANYPFTAFGVLSGYWLDRDCPLCRYCSFSIWSCMDSTTVESVDRPPTFA